MAVVGIALILLIHGKPTDWTVKEISFPSEAYRISFDVYLPKTNSGFKVKKAKIAWIPKLDDFPGRPARQVVLLTLIDKHQRIVDLIESPSMGIHYKENVNQILSQGYIGRTWLVGEHWAPIERRSISICLLSKEIDIQSLYQFGDKLVPYRFFRP